MPVNFTPTKPEDLYPVQGLRIGVTEAFIRKKNRKDLTVMLLDEGASVSGVFTTNRFCAAPVQLCKEHLAAGQGIRALVVNTGIANAGTGEAGLANARGTCTALGKLLNVQPSQILPFSTGVIMEPLPLERIEAGLPAAIADAKGNNWARAAEGIMTTDTVPKAISERIEIGGKTITVSGMSKGAGMIRPNMATMLGYLATDACIPQTLLDQWVSEIVNQSFNRVTVDGDTSTNDSFILIATNKVAVPAGSTGENSELNAVKQTILRVAQRLAQALVRDGEGATKFITVNITGGKVQEECTKAAYAIAHSPLVKTAFFASDPNLGRILAAVGYAGITDLDQSKISLHLDDVHIVQNGGRLPSYKEEDGARVMAQSEITVHVDLGRGTATDTVWTCDFSYDYVKINADYRS